MSTLLLCVNQRIKLLSYKLSACSTLIDTTKYFSKGFISINPFTRKVWVTVAPCSCQHLVISVFSFRYSDVCVCVVVLHCDIYMWYICVNICIHIHSLSTSIYFIILEYSLSVSCWETTKRQLIFMQTKGLYAVFESKVVKRERY